MEGPPTPLVSDAVAQVVVLAAQMVIMAKHFAAPMFEVRCIGSARIGLQGPPASGSGCLLLGPARISLLGLHNYALHFSILKYYHDFNDYCHLFFT